MPSSTTSTDDYCYHNCQRENHQVDPVFNPSNHSVNNHLSDHHLHHQQKLLSTYCLYFRKLRSVEAGFRIKNHFMYKCDYEVNYIQYYSSLYSLRHETQNLLHYLSPTTNDAKQ